MVAKNELPSERMQAERCLQRIFAEEESRNSSGILHGPRRAGQKKLGSPVNKQGSHGDYSEIY